MDKPKRDPETQRLIDESRRVMEEALKKGAPVASDAWVERCTNELGPIPQKKSGGGKAPRR